MYPEIVRSAFRHGVHRDDIVHAYRFPIDSWPLDEGMTMLVGPARDGQLLEIGVVSKLAVVTIVHAMRAREKFLRKGL